MLTAGQLENVTLPFEKTFSVLQSRILLDVIERIKKNGEITRAADWRIYRLHELGLSNAVIKDAIKHALSMSDSQIDKLYDDAVASGYAYDESVYTKMGVPFTPYKDNKALQQLVDAVKRQTLGEMVNITNSLGFAEKTKNGIKFTPIAKYYQQTLDSAMTDIASGAFSYNEVIGRTVKQLTDSGLRTVDYATGHSNRVDVAARRAVMTGFNQVTAKINDQNAEALGADHFEVSYHLGARPEHQIWQGRVYSKRELETVCGLGTVTGLCGANCRHSYSPFIPGISVRTYTDEELDELNAKANTPREFGGRQYTQYEATQRQRQLETTMRAEREKISLLEKAGADESDIIAARAKYRVTSSEYTRFSKAMDLPQQRERVTVDGLGNIGIGKVKVDKYEKGAILKGGYDSKDIAKAISQETTNFVTTDIKNPESLFGELVKYVPKDETRYDIFAHGSSEAVKIFDSVVDAQELAKIILSRKDYDGRPIRLVSCEIGKMKKGTCFAQQLADLLGVEVLAPTEDFNVSTLGNIIISSHQGKMGEMKSFFPRGKAKK